MTLNPCAVKACASCPVVGEPSSVSSPIEAPVQESSSQSGLGKAFNLTVPRRILEASSGGWSFVLGLTLGLAFFFQEPTLLKS